MKDYNNLVEAMNDLKKRGYQYDFNLHVDCVECKALDLKINPEQFNVDEFYRFEGMSNPDDSSVVYAISSGDGVKGVLVDAYGVYADSLSEEMIRKLTISR